MTIQIHSVFHILREGERLNEKERERRHRRTGIFKNFESVIFTVIGNKHHLTIQWNSEYFCLECQLLIRECFSKIIMRRLLVADVVVYSLFPN